MSFLDPTPILSVLKIVFSLRCYAMCSAPNPDVADVTSPLPTIGLRSYVLVIPSHWQLTGSQFPIVPL